MDVQSEETLKRIVDLASAEITKIHRSGETHLSSRRLNDTPSAAQVAQELFGDAVLYARRAAYGTWWYYLIMPQEWHPEVNEWPKWQQNPHSKVFWTSGHGRVNTKEAALVKGLQKLIDALY